jgi:hypothetical protein
LALAYHGLLDSFARLNFAPSPIEFAGTEAALLQSKQYFIAAA